MQDEMTGNVPPEVYEAVTANLALIDQPLFKGLFQAREGMTWGDLLQVYRDDCKGTGIEPVKDAVHDLQILIALEEGGLPNLGQVFCRDYNAARSNRQQVGWWWERLHRVIHVCPTMCMGVSIKTDERDEWERLLPFDGMSFEERSHWLLALSDSMVSVEFLSLDELNRNRIAYEGMSALDWYLHFRGFRSVTRGQAPEHVSAASWARVCAELLLPPDELHRSDDSGVLPVVKAGSFFVAYGTELFELRQDLCYPGRTSGPFAAVEAWMYLQYEDIQLFRSYESGDVIKRLCVIPKRG